MEIIFFPILLLAPLLGIAALVFWVWMLVDCLNNEPSFGNEKLIWVLVIVLTQLIGAIVYFFVRRPERIRQFGH